LANQGTISGAERLPQPQHKEWEMTHQYPVSFEDNGWEGTWLSVT